MAWLAKLDARAARLPKPIYWPYLAIKWYIVALGAGVWFGLWWQRHPLLAVGQGAVFLMIGWPSLCDRWPILRWQRRGDARQRDPNPSRFAR